MPSEPANPAQRLEPRSDAPIADVALADRAAGPRLRLQLPPGAEVDVDGTWSGAGPFFSEEDACTPEAVALAVFHPHGSGRAVMLRVRAPFDGSAVAAVELDPSAAHTLLPREAGLGVRKTDGSLTWAPALAPECEPVSSQAHLNAAPVGDPVDRFALETLDHRASALATFERRDDGDFVHLYDLAARQRSAPIATPRVLAPHGERGGWNLERGGPKTIAWAPDAAHLAVAWEDRVVVYTSGLQVLRSLPHVGLDAIAWGPSGKLASVGGGRLVLWRPLEQSALEKVLELDQPQPNGQNHLCWSDSSVLAVALAHPNRVQLYTDVLSPTRTISTAGNRVTAMCWGPGETLAVCQAAASGGGLTVLWAVRARPVIPLRAIGHLDEPTAVAISRTGALAVGMGARGVDCWPPPMDTPAARIRRAVTWASSGFGAPTSGALVVPPCTLRHFWGHFCHWMPNGDLAGFALKAGGSPRVDQFYTTGIRWAGEDEFAHVWLTSLGGNAPPVGEHIAGLRSRWSAGPQPGSLRIGNESST